MVVTENHIESYLANLKSEIVARFEATSCEESFESGMYILEIKPTTLLQHKDFLSFKLEKENEFVMNGFGAELRIWDTHKLKIFRGEIYEQDVPETNRFEVIKSALFRTQTWLSLGLVACLMLFLGTMWRYSGIEEKLDQLQAKLTEKSNLIQEKDQTIEKLQTEYESLKQQTQNKSPKTVILAKNNTKYQENVQKIAQEWLEIENCSEKPVHLGMKSIGISSSAEVKIQKNCNNKFTCFWTEANTTHMGIGIIEAGDINSGIGQIIFANSTKTFEIEKGKVTFKK